MNRRTPFAGRTATRVAHLCRLAALAGLMLLLDSPTTTGKSTSPVAVLAPPQIAAPELDLVHACAFAPTFTPDGDTMLMGVSVPDCGVFSTIVIVHRRDGRWSDPVVAPFSGRYSDFDPFLSPDGRTVYFISNRPVPPDTVPRRDNDIWAVDRLADGRWGTPRHLPPPINSDGYESSPTVTRDGTLFFASTRAGGLGQFDLYRATHITDRVPLVENLGPAVNSADADVDPFIAPDGRYLIFSSDRSGTQGDGDLYISCWTSTGWSPPQNLGPSINSPAWEFDPRVSRDGTTLYFGSLRAQFPRARARAWTYDEMRRTLDSYQNGIGHLYEAPIRIQCGT